jgi:hypothetical protein
LLYVDDNVPTSSSAALLQHTISSLKREFTMNDLGPLHHFLGVDVYLDPMISEVPRVQYACDI